MKEKNIASTQKKNATKSMKKKKAIEKVSQRKMDLTKLTQNEEIPIVETTNFDTDLFVKRYHEYKAFGNQKLLKFYQLKENQETW